NVVRFRRQQLLEDVSSAISFKRPNFHFAEALSAELSFATQRLLRDQRVRPNRASVDLVVDQVAQLQHIYIADRHRLLERLPTDAVVQLNLARARQPRRLQLRLDVFLGGRRIIKKQK